MRALLAALTIAVSVPVFMAACGTSSGGGSASPSASPTAPPTSATPTATATATVAPGMIEAAPGWGNVSASDFATSITNPWFPLKTGAVWVSRGIKDGKATIDTYRVTGQTKVILGVTCSVIRDALTQKGKVVEGTWDWYAQDKQGNVWYFGEDTKDYNASGQVTSTAGTWQAGVNGARPGVFMPANPQVGMGGYQEYYPGQALDKYKIIKLATSVTVPYGSFKSALETQETTALEPGVLDHKYYVKGIGQVAEQTVKGPKETSFLAKLRK
jgi:hypothetical protein